MGLTSHLLHLYFFFPYPTLWSGGKRLHLSLPQTWYLKSEIFSIQWFLLLLWRGAGAGSQCWERGKER